MIKVINEINVHLIIYLIKFLICNIIINKVFLR